MNEFRADLHIHTVLSPCGDLDMGPVNIIQAAKKKRLDIIAITDHNHTGHAELIAKMGAAEQIWVVMGAEVTTREEVHCLTFFEKAEKLNLFQSFIDARLPVIANDAGHFGQQLLVNEDEMILKEIEQSLYPGIDCSITELAEVVGELDGLFVPAHVDRAMNGLYAQLGFFPADLRPDAVEISRFTSRKAILELHPELAGYHLLENSDAHYPEDVGRRSNLLLMERADFSELRLALRGEQGRKVL